jgi:hypothetical protein
MLSNCLFGTYRAPATTNARGRPGDMVRICELAAFEAITEVSIDWRLSVRLAAVAVMEQSSSQHHAPNEQRAEHKPLPEPGQFPGL